MKKILVLLLTFSLVFSLTACGGGGEKEATGGGDGVMDVCIASEPATIDPALNSAVDGSLIIQHAFEGLIRCADDGKGNGTNAPGIAETWDVSEDGLQWTFHLRKDAKWSDGQPVVAGDFIYAWNRVVDPATAADYEYMLDMVAGYDEGKLQISAPDDYTFVVNLSAPCPYFEEICAFPSNFPVRKDILEASGDQWTFNPESYVCNGPYKMTEWEHNSYIMLEPNENYYGAADVTAKKIKIHLMDDANAIYAAFQSGQIDYIQSVPQDEIQNLIASGDLQIAKYLGCYYVCFQTQKAPFDNPKVREAFSLVIDRNFIVNKVTGRGEVVANGYVPAGVNDVSGAGGEDFRTVGGSFYDVSDEAYKANCDKARALLAEAGYPDGKGFPVVEYLYDTNDAHKAVGEALQNMWQTELGVQISLRNQEWNVFLSERKDGNFDIARGGWTADYNDPMTFLDLFVTGGGNNQAQYKNPEYDKLIQQAKACLEPQQRMDMLHQAETLMLGTDKIVAPIYFYTQAYMLNPNIKGMYTTPMGDFFFTNTTGW